MQDLPAATFFYGSLVACAGLPDLAVKKPDTAIITAKGKIPARAGRLLIQPIIIEDQSAD